MSEKSHHMESKTKQKTKETNKKRTEKERTLRFVSWNIRGFTVNTPKLDFVFQELKKKDAEIVFLQETHIGSQNYNTLKEKAEELEWECFFTVYDSQKRGVAILIKKDVPFQYFCHDEDYSGGYLVLFCHLHGELFTLVNVYNHPDDKDLLNRLQDYLRETAEGVLVVGGDFNTVLDLSFDRNSEGKKLSHTQLWDPFKKFTASLNLMDTWAYSKPRVREFTFSAKKPLSRLDMFLLPEDIIEQVSNLEISKTERIKHSTGTEEERAISDHEPLFLSLTLTEKTRKGEMPHVAACLKNHTYIRDESPEKINGAEILSVIQSLIDSGQQYSDGESLQDYKAPYYPKIEKLKISFNCWITETPESFNKQSLDFLIFVMVLAKRLKMLLVAYPEKKSIPNTTSYSVSFPEKPPHIKWTFLNMCLRELWNTSKKPILPGHFKIFTILKSILPKSSRPNLSDEHRELKEGCPLTRPILSLVLKYMAIHLKEEYDCVTICHYRQVLVLCKKSSERDKENIKKAIEEFIENSGIDMEVSVIKQ